MSANVILNHVILFYPNNTYLI